MSTFQIVSSVRDTADGSIVVSYTGDFPTKTEIEAHTMEVYGLRGDFEEIEVGIIRVDPSGYFEVMDATAIMRGHMLAARGSFSGHFSANNVAAVSSINIRDGSVGAFIFSEPGFVYKSNGASSTKVITGWRFFLPAFSAAVVVFRFKVNAIRPITVYPRMPLKYDCFCRLYRNGALISEKKVAVNNIYDKFGYLQFTKVNPAVKHGDIVTMLDITPPSNEPAEYYLEVYRDNDKGYLQPSDNPGDKKQFAFMTVFFK